MAKPTDEIIALPDFPMPMVQKIEDEMVESEIVLDQFVENMDKGLILYFYPRDNTPGCTTQAVDFTEKLSEFDALGYSIIGVSRDSIESHKKFIEKKQLQIPLISDPDEKLCQHFDVIKEKNMYGKKTMGLVRSTFVFDKDGKLTHAQRNLRAKDYADRLLKTLA
ncbi:peroxiredoxin [Psychrobacter phenylpyruvicus]|uniref:thioredoxin-dependent peroxiredoxin n=1 Tax=Psychrobacter phenylpyruvicus TaxID=29432 RepID=A0A379LKE7_9GAMM|nr:peroxiredoxin [Psychrobacter phenylpyruvicus]SUD90232.1 Putative peroxiredoxin Rv2521/MT2597 [Psychrobacter phenylpyruvicus]